MPQPRPLPHRLCKSEEPNNTGNFEQNWVGENITAGRRGYYMRVYLEWMRKETKPDQMDKIFQECKKKLYIWFTEDFKLHPRGRFYEYVLDLWVWLIWRGSSIPSRAPLFT
jgi:hypothetical protein